METVGAPHDGPQIKHMDIDEFMQGGYLQEANRLFFHPLGLALEIKPGKNGWYISGVGDVRDDLEGIKYDDEYIKGEEAAGKAQNIEKEMKARSGARTKGLGFVIQPLGNERPRKDKKTKREKGES